jgi:hypothetical protein
MDDELSLRIDDLDETVCELISHVETLERVISAIHQKLFCRCPACVARRQAERDGDDERRILN